MPILDTSSYRPPFIFRNRHINTIYAALCRSVNGVQYRRERWDTPDGDFLDIDWAAQGQSSKLLVAIHGMEGDSHRHYIRGVLKIMTQQGWDGLAINLRGCSGEPNRLPRAYHIGETGDLHFVLERIRALYAYDTIALAGFSLGGNIVLKYLGEQSGQLAPEIRKAVAISTPCHVPSAEKYINRLENRLYVLRFLSTLNPKMREKAQRFPGIVPLQSPMPRTLRAFDDCYTAPLHGFRDAEDYWTRNSSLPYIERIAIPTLLINAQDDSFLSPECFPWHLAQTLPHFYLAAPRYGGHVGFVTWGQKGVYWSEQLVKAFLEQP